MADRSHWWDGATWQESNGRWRVWDGAAWQNVDRAYAWDGAEWVLIYPYNEQIYLVQENALLLDRASVFKIDTFQQYTAAEAALLLDRAGVLTFDRNVNKTARELMAASEAILLGRQLPTTAEAALLLERAGVLQISRNVNKTGRELLAAAEAATVLKTKSVEAAEVMYLLERGNVVVISRNILQSGRDLIAATEAASVQITEIVPVVTNAVGVWPSCSGNANVSCSPGDNCESIKIRYRINDGGWGSWATMGTFNTTPNTAFGPETLNPTPSGGSGREIQFEIEPWTGDGGTGAAGTKITSTPAECGLA